jgi:hypothetical protein
MYWLSHVLQPFFFFFFLFSFDQLIMHWLCLIIMYKTAGYAPIRILILYVKVQDAPPAMNWQLLFLIFCYVWGPKKCSSCVRRIAARGDHLMSSSSWDETSYQNY